MELLEKRIMQDGEVYPGNILKVGSFLNHQMDIDLLSQMGQEWARLFAGEGVNKILTIEASGIGIACIAAQSFHCPVVFAKKSKSLNLARMCSPPRWNPSPTRPSATWWLTAAIWGPTTGF